MSNPLRRKPIHTRRVEYASFLREDGLYEIEGKLVDTIETTGNPIHAMALRISVDEELTIRSIDAVFETGPFPSCPGDPDLFLGLIGVQISPGWQQRVRQKIGIRESCTHHMELLFAMATAAYMAVSLAPGVDGLDPLAHLRSKGVKPHFLDGCRAWQADGPVVAALFPDFAVPMRG